MLHKKTIPLITALLLIITGTIIFNYSSGIPVASIIIFLCGAILYPVTSCIQRAGGRQRLDYTHTGEAAILSLIMIPVILHSKNWGILLAILIPAALAVTWFFKNIFNPFSLKSIGPGIAVNVAAALFSVLMIYQYDIEPEIIAHALTGPIRFFSPDTKEISFLYFLMLLLVTPAAMFYPRFRLMAQGENFYNSMRGDYTLTRIISTVLEAILLAVITLTIGIFGMGLQYLVKTSDEPAPVIITFLLAFSALQLILMSALFIDALSIISMTLAISYLFYLTNRGRKYLW